jgi:(R,R)-butanediol dehydrogenase/meso-butanediol dehydrogenase/diacetyl reductase
MVEFQATIPEVDCMRTAVWKQRGRFEIEQAPNPVPAAEEVVIRVEYCGVCGSDLHRAYTHGEIEPGVVIGHEYCGTIATVGPAVSTWKEGDRVVCASGVPEEAGEKPRPRFTPRMVARSGAPGTPQQGGFAEYKRMPAANLLRIPDSIDDLTASLIEPGAVAVHAVECARIGLGERLGILGLGPIGLLVLQVAKAAGALEVYGVDPSPVRRQAALDLGISAAIDPLDTDAVEELVSATGGGPEVMFDCAGAVGTLDQALTAVRAHGRVVLVAMSWDPVTVTPIEWIGRSVELRSMYAYSRRQCELSMKLIAEGKIRGAAMIRSDWIFPLDCIHQAFERSLEGTLVKAVIRP